jgi:hypothetical protein
MTPDDQPSQGKTSDEMLAAWLDGALDAESAARIGEWADNDKDFAMRAQRLQYLDDLVRQAVPADDAVPLALLQRLRLADVAAASGDAQGTVIDLADARRARAERSAPVGAFKARRSEWLRIAAQVALVAGVGLAVAVVSVPGQLSQDPAAEYRALGSAPDAATQTANVLVKFTPQTGADAARALARAAGVQLIGTPTATGAWKAAVAPSRRVAALETLRADARVVMAEPVDGAAP